MNNKVTSIFDILNVGPNEFFKINGCTDIYKINNKLELLKKSKESDKWRIEEEFTVIDLLAGIKIIKKKAIPTENDLIAINYGIAAGYKYVAMNSNRQIYFFTHKPHKNKTGGWSVNEGKKTLCELPISVLYPNDIEPFVLNSKTETHISEKEARPHLNFLDVPEQTYFTLDLSNNSKKETV